MALPAPVSAAPRGGPTAARFLQLALAELGKPYTWGGASPATGFDCSGLVQWALTSAGVRNVPRTSEAQWGWVQHIPFSELRPGDLIFEQWPGDQAAPGHVAIFTGTGKIEEAPQPGEPVHQVPWSPGSVTAAGGRIVGYGRVPGLAGTGGGATATLTGFPGSGLLSWPGDIVHAFASAGQAVDWLLQPSHWVRIFSGVAGTAMVGTGVFMMSHIGGEVAGMDTVPRAASLPLGIVLVGGGAVLLFVAFHNLPSNVTNFPELLGYLASSLRGGKTPAAAPAPASASSGSGDGGGFKLPGLPISPLIPPPFNLAV